MSPPAVYDSNSANEQPVALPSAQLVNVAKDVVLQPPLTRRGTGPGIIIFLPPTADLTPRKVGDKPLDPKPVQKWAEEGFAVVGVTASSPQFSVEDTISTGVNALLTLKELDTKNKFAVVGGNAPRILSYLSRSESSNV
jgi:carboxymethylenebutenolidase